LGRGARNVVAVEVPLHRVPFRRESGSVASVRRLTLVENAGAGKTAKALTLRDAEAPDARQLQRRPVEVEAERQPEDVHLQPLVPADQDAGEAEEGKLEPGPTRRRGYREVGQEVLPDCGRRELQPELGNGTAHVGHEGVAVRPGPRP